VSQLFIYSLFNNAVSNSDVISFSYLMMMN